MHPVLKCCGYYCSFLMLVGFFFFLIMLAMEATDSPYLSDFQAKSDSTFQTKFTEIGKCLAVINYLY